MNLAEAFNRGLIAEAIYQGGNSGLSLEQCLRGGLASAQVHEAGTSGSFVPQFPSLALSTAKAAETSYAEKICAAIRDAGRRLNHQDLVELSKVPATGINQVVNKLIGLGTLTRSGTRHSFRYGFPDMK